MTKRSSAPRKHSPGAIAAMLLVCAPLLTAASESPPAPAISPPAAAAPPDDGQWTMPAKNYASTRYSELAEINEGNVKNLQVAFTFSTGVNKGQEAAPLVVGSTMYIVSPFPNIVYALDLSKPGAPIKWKYEPNPEPAAQGVACCDVVNRGAAFADGRIFFNTLDGHTIALDANTGQPVWNAHVGNINIGETITMAPLVVKGKVLVGNSGGEMGVRGWVKALDAGDGHVVWTAYNTGPDKEVLIGPDFKPHYDMDKGKDLGVTTWPPEAWKIGGGNMWGWISYDPDLNLIFHGTGNPGPWNPDLRPGDNKWTSGIFARDPDTGAAKWFYQWTPHDLHDYDGINEQILLDMNWQGKPRKVLVRPERNGYLYVLDRSTGEVLSAKPYGPVNSSKGVDLKTGRLIENPDKLTGTGKVVRDICPTASGLKDWQPSAFSPKTGLLYIPHNNLCMDEEGVEVNYIAGTPYVGMNVRMIPGPGGNRGAFTAWDIAAEKPAWSLKENFPVWSGAVVTAGDVVFYGTMEGWFKAVSAKTGDLLWQFKTSSGIIGQPITYRGPDGHQYVAILSGVGGWAGAIVSGDLDPRDATAALGFVNAMKDLKNATTAGGTLYVFRLP
ncbi:methanol/ethanol family PQQ-dependent dehydrogenase [Mesorhizobium sp. CA18]|uniref:methanol/ethanol family PQQ-dependent dehydrogenase n=1 Tax=unclassified Mesorhizobium TaxID=325217 RepID=UPI001CC90314|nr:MULTISPECIES: methanol/ethanol family PQQ-dependent dehydrogenase [unclassified Mesorhizobium]MBZ9733627.1 methanol/ethanol family PQQ-dependent dehydrogenase [Mesorhizobium sp. CA9]MBZ9824292.1 methanol/ethanol family PQQ-dependent dehydrogenase [Mesorhizobium sp. CA18]MBZ9831222.1 methanol/ethanol family PQQ-dependent dehydrogenase [Mesorhizobium sp. CA2]MBZ9837386.1 methanol/ethanol family PQQ-dependent dehydrogenase [Mesorhizobium sp. CA3]MBZ9877330.1 methanol/ethanol family PQQ-depende